MDISGILSYAKAELICVMVLIILLYKSIRGVDTRYISRLFTKMIVASLIFVVCYAFGNLIDAGAIKTSKNINYVCNILYLSFNSVASYLWFLYSENVQEEKYIKSKRACFLCFLPAILSIILSIASWKTHWLFYIDETNCYQRGKYFILQYVIPYSYILVTTAKAFCKSFKKENYAKRHEYQMLGMFVAAPILLSALQFISLQTLPISTGTTIAVLIVYLNSQEILISIDPLTGLNNRAQLIRYLSQCIKSPQKDKRMYLFILDLNRFKKINDNYGHVEGDAALKRTADALKRVGKRRGCFLARYGGDEFIMVCDMTGREAADALCGEINLELDKISIASGTPYKLEASIGYTERTKEITSIPDFIKAADVELYKIKHSRE